MCDPFWQPCDTPSEQRRGGNPFQLLALGEASGRAASEMSLEGQGWRHRRGFRAGEPWEHRLESGEDKALREMKCSGWLDSPACRWDRNNSRRPDHKGAMSAMLRRWRVIRGATRFWKQEPTLSEHHFNTVSTHLCLGHSCCVITHRTLFHIWTINYVTTYF